MSMSEGKRECKRRRKKERTGGGQPSSGAGETALSGREKNGIFSTTYSLLVANFLSQSFKLETRRRIWCPLSPSSESSPFFPFIFLICFLRVKLPGVPSSQGGLEDERKAVV